MMLPSFEARMAIEDALAPVGYVLQLHQQNKLDLKSLAVIVSIGIAAHAGDLKNRNEERTQKMIFDSGSASDGFREAVNLYLLNFLYTPDDLQKKLAAEAEAEREIEGILSEVLLGETPS